MSWGISANSVLRHCQLADRHPDFRLAKDLLRNGDIGPGQNRPDGKRVTQVATVHGSAQSQVAAHAIMGFAETELRWIPGFRGLGETQ